MATPWKIIEAKPEAAAALSWRRWLGSSFDAVAALCLRKTRRSVERIPCDCGCACNHRVRKRGAAWVGVCDCGEECDDVPLTEADIKVVELDLVRLGRAVANALECNIKSHEFSLRRTWQVAEAGDDVLPVVLTMQSTEESFRTVVAELTARLPDGFILLAPTKQFCNAAIQELLARVRTGFFDLESNLTLRPDGSLEAEKVGAEWFARVLTPPTTRAATATAAPPEYLIRQESTRRRQGKQDRTLISTWRFWFKGHEVLMPPWVGAEYVVHLMHKQGRQLEAGALMHAVRKSGASVSSATASAVIYGDESGGDDGGNQHGRVGELNERDVIWDASEIASAIRKLGQLRLEIADHVGAGDSSSPTYLALKEALEERQELLSHNAKQVKGKWVPKEYQKGTAKEKAELIGKHVRKFLDQHVRDACRPLFDHLNDKAILKYGLKNCYRPEPAIPWKFEFKEGNKGT